MLLKIPHHLVLETGVLQNYPNETNRMVRHWLPVPSEMWSLTQLFSIIYFWGS